MLKLGTTRRAGKHGDSGYMLLFLMLAVAVLTITMLGVARNYRRSIIRDREVEMMHRGDQYARAVKRFYHKNGRYPVSIEQLEDMNKIRYLRKRYKDPMSPDGTWKLVHATDVKLTPTGGLTPAGASTGLTGGQTSGTSSGFMSGSASTQGLGANSSTQNSTTAAGTSDTGVTAGGTTEAPTSDTGTGNAAGSGTSGNAANQVLGGGDVYGVVSKMKTEGIHSFGDKSKYNEWFFIYVQAQDKNQLLVGPYNPKMFVGSSNSGLGNTNNGTTGNPTTNTPNSGAPGTVATPPATPTTP